MLTRSGKQKRATPTRSGKQKWNSFGTLPRKTAKSDVPVTQPPQVVDQAAVRLDSARFQSLLFGDLYCVEQLLDLTKTAKLDNSRLYGASTQYAGAVVLEGFVRLTWTVYEAQTKALFDALLQTGAQNDPNLVNKNLFKTAPRSQSLGTLALMLSRPDVFPIDKMPSALHFVAKASPEQINFVFPLIDTISKHPQAYTLFNTRDCDFETSLHALIVRGHVSSLRQLLLHVPLVDLDAYFLPPDAGCEMCEKSAEKCCGIHRWYSAEERAKNPEKEGLQVNGMIRCAREQYEEYRCKRAECVLRWSGPRVVCDLINEYGKRPLQA